MIDFLKGRKINRKTLFTSLVVLALLGALVVFDQGYIVLFLLILLALVIIHEFGHFIAAKLLGMRVDEFAFGFPPSLFSKQKGETRYSFNAIPLGGYVSIWGENGEPDDEAKHNPRAFGNRPKWAQLIVLIAGVFMNMVLALFIFIGLSFGKVQMSVDDPTYGSRVTDPVVVVVDAAQNSPAYLAGIVPGSVILSMVSGGERATLDTATSVISFIGRHQNDSFTIRFLKPEGSEQSTTIAAVYGIVPDKKALGLSVDKIGYVTTSVPEAISLGFQQTQNITMLTLGGLRSLVTSIGQGQSVLDSLSGPIGIAKIVGETSRYGLAAILTLTAVLSINLAIFNALPLPALDGGRVVMVLAETVTRRKIPFKHFSLLNIIGFSALILLVIVVTVNDIIR